MASPALLFPMICPFCTEDKDKVIDSRASEGGRVIRRRRQCMECSKRFTTYERIEETGRLTVIKRDGSRVTFNRENILRGVRSACGKRPIAEEHKIRLVDEIEDAIHRQYDREVESRAVGELVAEKLRQLDAGDFREYKLHNQPVGACQIIITTDKTNNKIQERKRLRPLFSCLRNV